MRTFSVWREKFFQLLRSQKGQALSEYAIVAAILIGALAVVLSELPATVAGYTWDTVAIWALPIP